MGRLWVLGSMGWMPRDGQETCSYLVECDDQLIMLDAGTGVSNLYRYTDVLSRYDRLSILLSHYHLDHMAGLMYLKRFCRDLTLDIYGPGKPVYPKTTEQYLSDFLQSAIYSSGPFGFARTVRYFDYGGKDFDVGETHIEVTPQRHSSPSFQLRLGTDIVYATDTAFDATSWSNVQPTHILLHECWQLSSGDPRHSSAEALVSGLPHPSFDHVLFIHHNPAWTPDDRRAISALASTAGISLAEDGMCIEF